MQLCFNDEAKYWSWQLSVGKSSHDVDRPNSTAITLTFSPLSPALLTPCPYRSVSTLWRHQVIWRWLKVPTPDRLLKHEWSCKTASKCWRTPTSNLADLSLCLKLLLKRFFVRLQPSTNTPRLCTHSFLDGKFLSCLRGVFLMILIAD